MAKTKELEFMAFGQNGLLSLFMKIYMNIPLFQKNVEIYHFFSTQVWRNQELNGTRVP